ncbi:hypothetical protein ACSTDZ_16850 [Vibrio vulnificus]|uniref:hypothetical protein n=1 Tax=Vibrio vulnificus TaxID=672 RepID=UPI0009B61BE2|nr:hypothetical protein [Vibrio vulnificus]OQK36282.1 hypothetical protein XM74_c21382 [Vibrio vulnificus]OQK50409.1 hypothetical protein XM76_c20012 [Vibrio vulnificus]OQK60944.1 hypothetical protein XM78_c20062 [Vibrio vulnificus]OQK63726.1 hypothetical protein XM79_c20062 [Vibrio vulnificus]POC23463.1 hypothetical protein CRN46_09960 [Vibrio vulnificus]
MSMTFLDAGYIFQRRWREAPGRGFSVQGGVRARLEYSTSAPLLDASDDDIYFNYSRFDVMWGPYVQFNAIFKLFSKTRNRTEVRFLTKLIGTHVAYYKYSHK